jgi:hypothetical protein
MASFGDFNLQWILRYEVCAGMWGKIFGVDDYGDLPREVLAKYSKEMTRKLIDQK